MWDFFFREGSERREIKEMNRCEKWKLTDLGNEIETVIVKLKNLLKQRRIKFLVYSCLFSKGMSTILSVFLVKSTEYFFFF